MGGLIPLLLPSGSSSGAWPTAAHHGHETKRPLSAMGTPSPPLVGRHRRQLSLPTCRTRSPSISVPLPQAVSPSTPTEWKTALNEVKQKYLGRKYRTCSARCCELLETLDDQSKIEPLHLIYLHFYAASSFEMCARPLSHSSTYRTKLLHDAREHYDRAASLIQKAEGETMEKGRSGSVSGSYSPLTSPTTARASPLHSPRPSISSLHSASSASAKPRKKKKVSFSGLPDHVDIPKPALQPVEPYIRPDSPTLGWDQDYLLFGRSDTNPPCAATDLAQAPAAEAEEVSPRTVVPESPAAASPSAEMADHSPGFPTFNLESFLQTKSANRVVRELSALRSQVTFHRDGVDSLLTASDEADETPSVPEVPPIPTLPGLARNISPMSFSSASESSADDSDGPVTPTSVTGFDHHAAFPPPKPQKAPGRSPQSSTLSEEEEEEEEEGGEEGDRDGGGAFAFPLPPLASPAPPPTPRGHGYSASVAAFTLRRSSIVVAPASIPRCASSASTTRPHHAPDEALQKRIERLRAGGWQRKRFDARRYEALREKVLGELGA